MMRLRTWAFHVAIALDQLVNALFCGWPDETISSRAWRWKQDGIRAWPCWLLDRIAALFGDLSHCEESYRSERTGRYLPPELRNEENRA
jgi:hypothetical protein